MRRHYRHKNKTKTIIGLALCGIGFLIIVNFIPMEVFLFFIGVVLLIMGLLIIKIK